MGKYDTPAQKRMPAGFWILLGICAVATVSLLAFAVWLFFVPTRASAEGNEPAREIYTEEDRYEYYRGFDATVLAAVVCDSFPDADECLLAEGSDENFIAMTVENSGAPMRLHFSLRGADMTFRATYPGYDRAFAYTTRNYEDVAGIGELAAHYGDHLRDRYCEVLDYLEADVDGDGEAEYIYLVSGVMESWMDEGDGTQAELDACRAMMDKTVCVYLNQEDGELIVHSFCLPGRIVDLKSALWDYGMLHLEHSEGMVRLFVSEPELSFPHYQNDPDLLRRICTRYAAFLEDQGYTDVRISLADISAVPGLEVICCYSDGMYYTSEVFAPRNGRLQTLFRKEGTKGSVYIVAYDGLEYLMDYSQQLSDADYSLTYRYCLFRFDENDTSVVEDEDSLWVASNQGGGQTGSSFFAKLNGYLQMSTVCYDPYGLTGYSLMEGGIEQDMGMVDPRYLHITNCSTNKTGVVTLRDDDSWLNLRSGPSTAYDTVLINPNDRDSLVKQVQGSLVTVIMPYNTGDRANPIWCQIQISYRNRTMVGCSSQKYIRIEGIRHLVPGEQFTIMVDNYDLPLTWVSSDPSVASIDSVTGTLTAHRSGLVLITVTNAGGLEDSCLIMID